MHMDGVHYSPQIFNDEARCVKDFPDFVRLAYIKIEKQSCYIM